MNIDEILTDFGISYTKAPEHFKVKCPFHNDSNPSGTVNNKTGFFNCFACGKKASLAFYLVKYSNLPVYQVNARIGYRSDCKHPISPMEIENYHADIWKHPTFLKELHDRCVTDELIRKYRLGVKDTGTEKRVVIPILNDIGEYANLRLYIPSAKSRKFLNLSGKDRSKIRLFPIEQLNFDQILICAGEMKAIAAAAVLNKYDIGAIAPTCGENTWPNELTNRFYGKLVYINCDVDEIGKRYSELRCRILKSVARAVHKVEFTPEQVGGLEKGDLNDFLRLNKEDDALYKLLVNTPEWAFVPGGEVLEELPLTASFREAFSPDNAGKRLQYTGVISSISSNSYLAPSVVQVSCSRDQEFCMVCDVNSQAFSLNTEMKIGKEHPAILSIIGERTSDHDKTFKECFKIPRACKSCSFKRLKEYSITEVRLDEQIDPTSRIEPLSMKIGYIVDNTDASSPIDSQSYIITGRLYPSPKNQIASFLIGNLEPTEDALDSYESLPASHFNIFQPKEWTLDSVREKLDEIYSDLEANITRIWQRRELHIAYDLAYHSMLHFNFNNIKDLNAWVEVLVIGDTGQGKSKVLNSLRTHYGLGAKVDCKNVTIAGLTIGLESTGGKYFAVYGTLVKNDRQLVIFEELKGMDSRVFQKLTEIRSSGVVQVTKISSKEKRARVRNISISNPVDPREVASYTYGIESALGVIGTQEDLRRYDFVLIVGKNDIDKDLLNQYLINPPIVQHKFTDELCQKLILKAWKCEKVEFEDTQHILQVANELIQIFGEGLPILDSNSSHIKIAKLSAALAARTCSYENEILIVRKCHVEYIKEYLIKTYSSPSSRLDEKSKSIRNSMILRDKEGLINYLKSITSAADVMQKLSETDIITCNYVKDLCGDFYLGTTLFSKLIKSNAIIRVRSDKYTKTAEFTKLLSTVQFEITKPDYIQKMDI